MPDFVQRIDRAIERDRLLAQGSTVLVAVSGGIDSMVLLRVLHTLSDKHRWQLVVGHFNHQLRGKEADADERFVTRAANKLGLRCVCGSADVRQFARAQKLSLEMAARQLRHNFLARTAVALGIATVGLAHHADDQVELVVLRWLRGAGSHGLGGMRPRNASPSDHRVTLARPLLGVSREDIKDFARRERIRFRDDASNSSTDFLRNRVRHDLLPLIRRKYQPAFNSVVLCEAEILRDEAEFISREAERWLASEERSTFSSLPVALQRRVLQLECYRAGVLPDFTLLEELRNHAGRWIMVQEQQQCRRDEDGRVHVRSLSQMAFPNDDAVIDLGVQGNATLWDGVEIKWQAARTAKLPKTRPFQVEFFDADQVGGKVVLRHWRAGDRFQPIGLAQPVKLQDLFVNQKIPRNRRHTLVIAATHVGEIFWVEGLRIGDRFKITGATQRRLRWEWRRQ